MNETINEFNSIGGLNININPLETSFGQITKSCFDWCKEQRFIYDMDFISIIAIAFGSMMIARIIFINSDFVQKHAELSDEGMTRLILSFYDFATLLLIGFFIYMRYFWNK